MLRPATFADIDAVLADLSDINRGEIASYGVDPGKAAPAFKSSALTGRARALADEQGVLFVWCHYPSDAGRSMWFIATTRFFQSGARGFFAMRRALRSEVSGYPPQPWRCVTRSTHPDSARWFRLLGFEQIDRNVFLFRGR